MAATVASDVETALGLARRLRTAGLSGCAACDAESSGVRELVQSLQRVRDGGGTTWPVQPWAEELASELLSAAGSSLFIVVRQAVEGVAACEASTAATHGDGSLRQVADHRAAVSLALQLLQLALLEPMWDFHVRKGAKAAWKSGQHQLATASRAVDQLGFLQDNRMMRAVFGALGDDGSGSHGLGALLQLLLTLAVCAREADDGILPALDGLCGDQSSLPWDLSLHARNDVERMHVSHTLALGCTVRQAGG
jgi:hypothetical protein